MRILDSLQQLPAPPSKVVLAAGVFDGVHRGHQLVIQTALDRARALAAGVWVMTFEPHPLRVLQPARAPALITSLPHKLSLLESLGIAGCVTVPFTPEFAALEPDLFLSRLRGEAPALAEIVVGNNWTYGHLARGDVRHLQERCRDYGFSATIVDGLVWQDDVISSTRIRRAITSGKLADAAAMLGRRFSILGTVIPGKQLGRQLGFPTANLDPHNEVFPPGGIYAVWARVNGRRHPGAAFLGSHYPIHDPAKGTVEVHVIGAQLELYGRDIEVEFVERLRDEKRFATLESLKAQIGRDVAHAGELLARTP